MGSLLEGTISGVLGSVSFDLRPSNFRKGLNFPKLFRIAVTVCVASMLSFHSPLGKSWAMSGLGSFRHGVKDLNRNPLYRWGGFCFGKNLERKSSTWITLCTPQNAVAQLRLPKRCFKSWEINTTLLGNRSGKPRNARQHRAQFPYLFF